MYDYAAQVGSSSACTCTSTSGTRRVCKTKTLASWVGYMTGVAVVWISTANALHKHVPFAAYRMHVHPHKSTNLVPGFQMARSNHVHDCICSTCTCTKLWYKDIIIFM